ncbi:hypothetical protein EGW08_000234, partial [Elysia chlorotica]
IKREFPVALVTAASVAAFCILLFFLLAYIWHTRQLDSRARKLAIRLAADAEDERRGIGRCVSSCRNCGPSSRGRMASSSSSGRSGGRGAHRKWSRSKKSSCSGSQSLEKRDSAVTDKEILTHFASRRHSTFFI